MNFNIKTLKEKNGIKLIDAAGNLHIEIIQENTFENHTENYSGFEIMIEENKMWIRFERGYEYVEDLYELISSQHSKGKNIFEILKELSSLLKTSKTNYLKLRGDIGEAMYLIKFGGDKISDMDGLSFDLINNGEYIEVKTFSPTKNTVIFSLQQLMEKNRKFFVPLYNESKSGEEMFNIIELSEMLKSTSPNFYEMMQEKYSKSNLVSNLKYRLVDPVESSKINFDEFVLPTFVNDAKFEILIKELIDEK